MAQKDLFDSQGNQIRLGSTIGRGGEGEVFEVLAPDPSLVAKLYYTEIDSRKQEKLAYMTKIRTAELSAVSAWPASTVHIGRAGKIAGFMMESLKAFEPIHRLYNPAQRKELYPDVDWAFLVQVARNTAAAFAAIHNQQHVVADVNEQCIQVNRDATVKLIDCDSFQVTEKGRIHLCGVGVRLFTPPELQTAASFDDVVRTTNHDNFGLALICFHLLFMGRHPFAGVRPGVREYQIEDAIRDFAFAYGNDASKIGIRQPPGSLPLSVIIPELQSLFERAFGKGGAAPGNGLGSCVRLSAN